MENIVWECWGSNRKKVAEYFLFLALLLQYLPITSKMRSKTLTFLYILGYPLFALPPPTSAGTFPTNGGLLPPPATSVGPATSIVSASTTAALRNASETAQNGLLQQQLHNIGTKAEEAVHANANGTPTSAQQTAAAFLNQLGNSSGSGGRRKRRHRTIFSEEQLQMLEQAFNVTQDPGFHGGKYGWLSRFYQT